MCPSIAFGLVTAGYDSMGYAYQRMRVALCRTGAAPTGKECIMFFTVTTLLKLYLFQQHHYHLYPQFLQVYACH